MPQRLGRRPPGEALRIALLPEGQDPDDLARSGGRAAIEEVISAARPLADMIWSREIEGGNFDTPERRAAQNRRLALLAAGAMGELICGSSIAAGARATQEYDMDDGDFSLLDS